MQLCLTDRKRALGHAAPVPARPPGGARLLTDSISAIPMDPELRSLLADVKEETIAILVENEIYSVEDAKMLKAEDLDKIGFKLAHRKLVFGMQETHVSCPV